MGQGIRIQSKDYKKVTDALDAAGIEHSVWNAEVMFNPDYDGPIDLECDDSHKLAEFDMIVRGVIES